MTICEKKAEKTKMGQDVEFFPLDSQFIFLSLGYFFFDGFLCVHFN